MSFQDDALSIFEIAGVKTRLSTHTFSNLVGGLYLTVRKEAGSLLGTSLFDRARAIKYARQIGQAAEETGAVVWVSHGSLLGLIREGNLLLHDKDLDFSVFDSLNVSTFLRAIGARGFVLQHVEGDGASCLYLSFRKRGIPIDFYFCFPRASDDQLVQSLYFRHDEFSAERVDFSMRVRPEGISRFSTTCPGIPIPQNSPQILEQGYGQLWMEPRKKWSIIFDPPNASQTGMRETMDSWLIGLRERFN